MTASRLVAAGRWRRWLLPFAALLFASVFVLHGLNQDPGDLVGLLYALPIALVAVERGLAWGLAAAALGLCLFALWDVLREDASFGPLSYLIRGAAFATLGGAVGALADRLRAVSVHSDRIWQLSTDLLCTAGFDGYFKRVNPAWERTLGWSEEQLLTTPFIELVHPDDRERTAAEAADLTSAAHETRVFENRYRCKDGSYRTFVWGARSVPAAGLIYASARDTTDSALAALEAESARAEAERANLAKSDFLSRMSHELRTPLNAVIGFSQLLALDDMNRAQTEAVEQILKAGRHLLELINDVLDISRIESGMMSLSLEPVEVAHVLGEAVALIRPLADAADVTLVVERSERDDLHALADQQRLKQVLINLLSNAVKYNRRGGRAGVRCEQLGDGRIELTVSDSGLGMDADQLERIFEPFDRLGAQTSEIEGTGLGLSLSKGLIEAMGGTISVQSEPGVGSTLRVRLTCADEPRPDATTARVAPVAAGAPSSEPRTIVYIEDNLSNLKLVERLLARCPHVELITAMQGKLAIDLAREHQPDLILLDLHLPDLHGRRVLEQLKRDPVTSAIPVVVLSADASPAQEQRLRRDGAAGCLTKPIDPQALLAIVLGGVEDSPSDAGLSKQI